MTFTLGLVCGVILTVAILVGWAAWRASDDEYYGDDE